MTSYLAVFWIVLAMLAAYMLMRIEVQLWV